MKTLTLHPDCQETGMDALTLPAAFQQTAAAHPDAVALRTPGGAESLTWREYAEAVARIAGGLHALGVRRGDTVAAMLTNRPEFHLQEAAASHLGAVTYSIYNTNPVDGIRYLLEHAETRVVITERQFAEQVKAAGGPVEHILVVDDGDLDALRPAPDFDFEGAWRAVQPDDVLCLIYTSGTTGPPKGVEHTHGSVLASIESLGGLLGLESGDRYLSFLPAAHIADRLFSQYIPMVHGTQVTSASDPRQFAGALADARPTIWAAVPRIWEKLKLGVELQLQADDQLRAAFEGGSPQVLAAVRTKLGLDDLRWALTGSAATPPDVFAFLVKLGIPVSDCWGMSECGIGSGTTHADARAGSVGRFVSDVEGRLADDGELLVRGPMLMRGYRNDPAKTAEAIDADGWLHTGDVATIDEEGYIRIVDRKKELIINAGGKNMSPSNIENVISSGSPLIGSVMAVGDGRAYNVALVTLDPDAAAVFAAQNGLDADPGVLVKDPRVQAAVQAGVDAGNARLARVEQIKQFVILPTYWEPGSEELTPTMKLKRRSTIAKYSAEIDELYAIPADA